MPGAPSSILAPSSPSSTQSPLVLGFTGNVLLEGLFESWKVLLDPLHCDVWEASWRTYLIHLLHILHSELDHASV